MTDDPSTPRSPDGPDVTQPMADDAPRTETVIGRVDRYALLRRLGAGGFGAVYRARDEVADMDVAIKVLPPVVAHNPDELAKVRENFKLVAKLRHPNIANVMHLHDVQVVDEVAAKLLGVKAGDRLIVMDFIPGATLTGWRRQFPDGRVPTEEALAILSQLVEALDYAHSCRIIHRDIKPANIIVQPDGKVSILDFGLAAEIRSSMSRVSHTAEDRAGTPAYMAPEQWAGRRQDSAVDQYGLAVVAYELFGAQVPFASAFEGASRLVMYHAVQRELPERLSQLSRRQNRALQRALGKEPRQRFGTCSEFVRALGGNPGRIPSSSLPEDMVEAGSLPRGGGSRVVTRIAVVLAIFLVLMAAGGVMLLREIRRLSDDYRQRRQQAAEHGQRAEHVAELLAEAQGALAAEQYADALRKAKEVLALDPANADATAVKAKAQLEIGLDVILPVRSEAQVRLKRITALDREQGFGEAVDRAQNLLEAAHKLTDAREYELALERYEQFKEDCAAIEAREQERQTAARERTASEAAAQRAEEAGAPAAAPDLLADAAELAGLAESAFGRAEFSDAQRMWTSACAQYARAEAAARGALAVQTRKEAYSEAFGAVDAELLDAFGGVAWEAVLSMAADAERLAADGDWGESATLWEDALPALEAAVQGALEAKARAEAVPDGANEDLELRDAQVAAAIADGEAAKVEGNWEAVLAHVAKALALNPDSERALELQQEAELVLRPRVHVVALADGADLEGAGVYIDGQLQDQATPGTFPLVPDRDYTIGVRVTAVRGQRRYLPAEVIYRTVEPGLQTVRIDMPALDMPHDLVPVPEPAVPALDQLPEGAVRGRGMQEELAADLILPIEVRTREVGIPLRLVPPGSVVVQRLADEDDGGNGELLLGRRMEISEPFYIGATEVTVGQWERVLGEPPDGLADREPQHPVSRVSYEDAVLFCRGLNQLEGVSGGTYRLPTDPEWEHAARAGIMTDYLHGNGADGLQRSAWYVVNSGGGARDAGTLAPTPWGLHDVHGNVWEWCNAAALATLVEPDAGGTLAFVRHTVRGGGWSADAAQCRFRSRRLMSPIFRASDIGVRLVRVAPMSDVPELD